MRYLAYWPLVAGALIGILIAQWLRNPSENHPWRVLLILGLVALIASVVWWLFASDLLGWALPGIVLLGGFWGLIEGWDARDNYLTPYCEYGARSEAQRDSCLSRVNTEDIDKLNTPAAQFARGEIQECGPGSGPFCDLPGEG